MDNYHIGGNFKGFEFLWYRIIWKYFTSINNYYYGHSENESPFVKIIYNLAATAKKIL